MILAMTNPPDPGKETRIVPVHGKNIVVRMLTDAQYLLLAREARVAQQPDLDNGRRLTAISRIFDILETAMVQDSDREYCVDLAAKGQLTLADMLGFINAFGDEEEKPKVRRGRPSTKRT
jgi:hypothetical protein